MDEAYKQRLHQEITNATVKILIGETFKGTGFFISPDGYVLTAYHCIGPYPPDVWVETRFDGQYQALLEEDKSLLSNQFDIAVLRIFNYRPKHFVPLGLIGRQHIGDEVVAIGYPAGQFRVYEGKIGGVDDTTLASDVIRGEGQSGGLVYHYRTQRVVGLASAIFKPEVIVNEGSAVRFENLFRKWSELAEVNQNVATVWDKRLQRLSRGEQEKPVKPKISWARILDLIIVSMIIGILAVVATPTHNCYKYKERSKMAEAISMLAGLKRGSLEYYDNRKKWPTVASITNVTTGKYVSLIKELDGGKTGFYAIMKDTDLSGPDYSKVFTLFYSTPEGIWKCDAAGTVNSGKPTSIDVKHLPSACR